MSEVICMILERGQWAEKRNNSHSFGLKQGKHCGDVKFKNNSA